MGDLRDGVDNDLVPDHVLLTEAPESARHAAFPDSGEAKPSGKEAENALVRDQLEIPVSLMPGLMHSTTDQQVENVATPLPPQCAEQF